MAQAASKTCEICVSSPGSCYCLECEQCFCENCRVLHSRQKISANHEFKGTSDFIQEVKSKCTDHNEVFSFVCVPCDVPVCGYCLTEKHNGHKMSQLKNTIAQLKTKIEHEILTKVNKAMKASGNVSSLEQNLLAFNDQVESVIKSITEEGNTIKSMVDQYTANKIASLQEYARKESKRLSAILSDHNTAFENANALNNRKISIEEQSRHDGRLIKMLKALNEDIDKIEIYSLPVFPSATYTPKEVNENDILQLLGTCKLVETIEGIRTSTKGRKKVPPPLKPTEGIYTCIHCGSIKKRLPFTLYDESYFTCCQLNMYKNY